MHHQYIWLLVVDLNPTPHTVLALLVRALGWDDPHQLKQGDVGHPDGNFLVGKKRGMLLPELFVAH